MAKNELKTKVSKLSPSKYINAIENAERRRDCQELDKILKKVTGSPARMWGTSMVGYGSYHYRYASGWEGTYFLAGFSSRKNDLTIYIMAGFDRFPELMQKLGKFKTGKSSLYIKRLDDIDRNVLEELIQASVSFMNETYSVSG